MYSVLDWTIEGRDYYFLERQVVSSSGYYSQKKIVVFGSFCYIVLNSDSIFLRFSGVSWQCNLFLSKQRNYGH